MQGLDLLTATFFIGLCACLLSVFSIVCSVICWVELRTFNKSTHNIQYAPMQNEEEEDWAMTDKQVDTINKEEAIENDLEFDSNASSQAY